MRMYTDFKTTGPIFAAFGNSKYVKEEEDCMEVVVFLFAKYEEAQKKACEMIYQSYSCVSVERVSDL